MTKDELRAYRHIKAELYQLDMEREYWYAKAERCTRSPLRAPIFSGEHDPMPHIMDKITELQEAANSKYDELIILRKRIENAVERLEGIERVVIRARYIEGKRWEKIAVDLKYSIQHIWRIHGTALKKLESK